VAGVGARPTLPPCAGGRRPRRRPPPVDAVHARTREEVYFGRPDGRRHRSVGTPPLRVAAAAGTRRQTRQPIGRGLPVGRSPSRPPHRGVTRVRAGAAAVARRRRYAAQRFAAVADLQRANGVPRKGPMANVDRPLSINIPQPDCYGRHFPVVDLGGGAAHAWLR